MHNRANIYIASGSLISPAFFAGEKEGGAQIGTAEILSGSMSTMVLLDKPLVKWRKENSKKPEAGLLPHGQDVWFDGEKNGES